MIKPITFVQEGWSLVDPKKFNRMIVDFYVEIPIEENKDLKTLVSALNAIAMVDVVMKNSQYN